MVDRNLGGRSFPAGPLDPFLPGGVVPRRLDLVSGAGPARVQPGDVISSNLVNSILARLDAIERQLSAVTIVSLAFVPQTATSGDQTTGLVTLSSPAPSATTLALSSDDPTVAAVPAQVAVSQGQQTVTFPVTAVNAGLATITATLAGAPSRAMLLLVEAQPVVSVTLTQLSLDSKTVVSGAQVNGTVTLSGPAPTATVVNLVSDNPQFAIVPRTTTVAQGQTSATFAVTTSNPGSVTITASLPGSATTASDTLTIKAVLPLAITSLTFSPETVVARGQTIGTITLNQPAPTDTSITVASDNAAVVAVQSPVTIAARAQSQTFTATAGAIAAQATATVTATLPGGAGKATDTLTVLPQQPPVTIASLSLSPKVVLTGGQATGSVTLSRAAPDARTVTLSSDNAGVATVQNQVTIGQGQSSATFLVSARGIGTATITGNTAAVGSDPASSGSDTLSVRKPKDKEKETKEVFREKFNVGKENMAEKIRELINRPVSGPLPEEQLASRDVAAGGGQAFIGANERPLLGGGALGEPGG